MVKKLRVKRIGVLSVANMVALIYAVLSVVYFFTSLATGELVYGGFWMGVGGFFVTLITFTLLAWIAGAVAILLYNLFAKMLRGIELTLESA